MMDEKEQQAWDECLLLWKKLSETPTQKIEGSITFKLRTLEELGIGERMSGCPFCEFIPSCVDCPIYGCRNTPYNDWFVATIIQEKHHKSKAKEFYDYLLKRYEERKKEAQEESG